MSDMTNDEKPRQPSGSPAGGQWASKDHAEPDVSLAGSQQTTTYQQALENLVRADERDLARLAREQYPDATTLSYSVELDEEDGLYFPSVLADGKNEIERDGDTASPRVTLGLDVASVHDVYIEDDSLEISIDTALSWEGPELNEAESDYQAAFDRDVEKGRANDALVAQAIREDFPGATGVRFTREIDYDGTDSVYQPYVIGADGEELGELDGNDEAFWLHDTSVAGMRAIHGDDVSSRGRADTLVWTFPTDNEGDAR